jgi:valyl-tRNA synthetase
MTSKWPEYSEKLAFAQEENQIEQLKEVIVGIRNLRTNMNVHPTKKSKLIFVTNTLEDMINSSKVMIEKLGFANEIEIRSARGEVDSNSSSIMTEGMEVIIPFGDLVDLEEERKRLEGEIQKLEAEVARASKMLSNPGFTSKAPAQKIEEEKQKLAKYEEMLKLAKERLEKI